MTESVPASARTIPPDTGASTTATWRAASSAARDFVPTGLEELISSTTLPGAKALAIPPCHSITASRTASPSGSIVRTTITSAKSRGDPAAMDPCSLANCWLRPLSRSWTTRLKPPLARLRAMRHPILPSPTTPTAVGVTAAGALSLTSAPARPGRPMRCESRPRRPGRRNRWLTASAPRVSRLWLRRWLSPP